MSKRDNETQTGFTIRLILAEAFERAAREAEQHGASREVVDAIRSLKDAAE